MKRISKVMMLNNNHVLLQLRDNGPNIAYPNTWTLFGGRIKDKESPENALKRELNEELGLELTHFNKLFTKIRNQDGETVEDNIFTTEISKDISNLNLNEGQKMQFFSRKELENINVFPAFKKYILNFFNNETSSMK